MKKLIIICVCVLLTFFSSLAYSAAGPYGRLDFGATKMTDADLIDTGTPPFTFAIESKIGITFAAALGYDFGSFRVEAEAGYQVNDLDFIGGLVFADDEPGDVVVFSYLLNGYYDIHTTTALTPFISAGLGVAKVEFDGFDPSNRAGGAPNTGGGGGAGDLVFAYQIGAGMGYAVTEKVTIDANYRFFGTSDPEYGSNTTWEFTSHNFFLGIRYYF